jgi:hypothetical protein
LGVTTNSVTLQKKACMFLRYRYHPISLTSGGAQSPRRSKRFQEVAPQTEHRRWSTHCESIITESRIHSPLTHSHHIAKGSSP